MKPKYFGGLDFGSSGARISIIDCQKTLTYSNSNIYKYGFKNPKSWLIACEDLLINVPEYIKKNLGKDCNIWNFRHITCLHKRRQRIR